MGILKGAEYIKKNGIYYRVGFCNKYPSEKWGNNGYIRGVYEPEIVKQMTREITITEYVPITNLDKG